MIEVPYFNQDKSMSICRNPLQQRVSRKIRENTMKCEKASTQLIEGQSVIKTKKRELSSAGLEHLPYKQRVDGSIPPAPTENQALRM